MSLMMAERRSALRVQLVDVESGVLRNLSGPAMPC